MSDLILRTSVRRSNGLDEYDVLSDGEVVGSISLATSTLAVPCGRPWMWTLACSHDSDRAPTHGFAVTREAASRCDASERSCRLPRTIRWARPACPRSCRGSAYWQRLRLLLLMLEAVTTDLVFTISL